MEMPGIIKKIHLWIEDDKHWLTRRKLTVFGVTLIIVGLLLGLFESADKPDAPARSDIIDISIPHRPSTAEPPPPADEQGSNVDLPVMSKDWVSVEVRPGLTLDGIFRKQGFDIPLLHEILRLNDDTRGLTRIKPGEVFDFKKSDDGSLSQMRYALDEASYLIIENEQGELTSRLVEREIVAEIHQAEGKITSSLFLAGKQAGLSDNMIMKLAGVFAWDIDFILDIRDGDHFMLVFEKLYREGEFLRDGRLLAATFINQGERFQAIYFEEGDIAGHFTPAGRPMKKAFLRAPLNFSYISSGFNPRRMHPVLKRVRPHNGIDYYAPRGTPVYAAGNGVVTRSDYSRSNGHHVFIKHSGGIETRYLHFTKRKVKNGQKVKQGQTIGTVGSTGLATGPHLHYEFLVSGSHRNPRTVPLPKVEALKGNLLASFQAQAAPMLTQLSRMESASLYASRE